MDPDPKPLSLPSGAPEVTEDEAVWMEDGNLIIRAGTDPVILFKCHRSILSAASDVFKGMLLLPPSDTNATYQGMPVVDLPDAAEDVQGLLRLLYDRSLIPRKMRGNQETCMRIAGPLRLAHKYMMERLLQELSSTLEQNYPCNLSEWLNVHQVIKVKENISMENTVMPGGGPTAPVGLDHNAFYGADPAFVIRLARDIGLDAVLPVAFYELCMWYPNICADLGGPSWDYEVSLDVNLDYLYHSDKLRLDRGREALDMSFAEAWCNIEGMKNSANCVHQSGDGEADPSMCMNAMQLWCNAASSQFFQLRFVIPVPRSPLHLLDFEHLDASLSTSGQLANTVCYSCRQELSRELKRRRQEIWLALPQIFGIDGVQMDPGY